MYSTSSLISTTSSFPTEQRFTRAAFNFAAKDEESIYENWIFETWFPFYLLRTFTFSYCDELFFFLCLFYVINVHSSFSDELQLLCHRQGFYKLFIPVFYTIKQNYSNSNGCEKLCSHCYCIFMGIVLSSLCQQYRLWYKNKVFKLYLSLEY